MDGVRGKMETQDHWLRGGKEGGFLKLEPGDPSTELQAGLSDHPWRRRRPGGRRTLAGTSSCDRRLPALSGSVTGMMNGGGEGGSVMYADLWSV